MEPTITEELIAAAVTLFSVYAYHRLTIWREDRNERHKAAVLFRAAINTDFIGDLRGHALVSALGDGKPGTKPGVEGVYYKHRLAVSEFRNYLDNIGRNRLDLAWTAYHGGNEERPDFLVLYGIPENGAEILKHRLESLRKVGTQT